MRDAWNTEQVWQRWLAEYYGKRPRPEQIIHAIATVTLLATEDGGRQTAVQSGYRGQFYYDDHDWDARYTFATDPVEPGQTAEAIIEFLSPWAHTGHLSPGKGFLLREGNKTVAHGEITWVHEILAAHDTS